MASPKLVKVTVADDDGTLLFSQNMVIPGSHIDIVRVYDRKILFRFGEGDTLDLRWRDLSGADLRGLDIPWHRVMLNGANLAGAKFPAPTKLLLANWGRLSPKTTLELMRLDASAHPDPKAFDRWADGGPCPYEDSRFYRVASFAENKLWWHPGPAPTIWEATKMVLDECCPGWGQEVKK